MSETNPPTPPSEDIYGEVLGSLLSISVAARNPAISPKDLQERVEVLKSVTEMLPAVTAQNAPLRARMEALPSLPGTSEPLAEVFAPDTISSAFANTPSSNSATQLANDRQPQQFDKKWFWPAGATVSAVLILAFGSMNADKENTMSDSATTTTVTTVTAVSAPEAVPAVPQNTAPPTTTAQATPRPETQPTPTTQATSEITLDIEPSPQNISIQVLS